MYKIIPLVSYFNLLCTKDKVVINACIALNYSTTDQYDINVILR